jgi:hypothetical protein
VEQGICGKGERLPFFDPRPLVINARHKNIHNSYPPVSAKVLGKSANLPRRLWLEKP